ncbi:MAG TPA: hypothetical protein VFZ32_03830 [Micromonosporaceae bacterium]
MQDEAIHGTIINLDVEGSSQLTNPEKLIMRRVLYDVISNAYDAAKIPSSNYHLEDRGDGQLSVIQADVAKVRIVGTWLATVDKELGHRNAVGDVVPIRLRIGVHAGEVHRDDNGVAGSDIDLTCRLVDAPVVKETLAAAHGACVVAVVSDVIYQSVVCHGDRYVVPRHYSRIRISVKETDVPAWITVPGYSVPPVPLGTSRRATLSQNNLPDRASMTELPSDGGGHNISYVTDSRVRDLHVGDTRNYYGAQGTS